MGRQSSSASGPSGHHVVQPPPGSNERAGEKGDWRSTSSSPSYTSVFGVNVATETPLGTTLLKLEAIDIDDGALALRCVRGFFGDSRVRRHFCAFDAPYGVVFGL